MIADANSGRRYGFAGHTKPSLEEHASIATDIKFCVTELRVCFPLSFLGPHDDLLAFRLPVDHRVTTISGAAAAPRSLTKRDAWSLSSATATSRRRRSAAFLCGAIKLHSTFTSAASDNGLEARFASGPLITSDSTNRRNVRICGEAYGRRSFNTVVDGASAISDEQRELEEKCGITVHTMLGICTVVQALPICLARGAIRRRVTPGSHGVNGRFAVHHVVPIAFATHDILWRMKAVWDQNDPTANGIVLPTSQSQSLTTKLPYHAGPHPQYSRCIETSLDEIAKCRDRSGWTSEQLAGVFLRFVSDVRASVLSLPPGSSVNACRVQWIEGERGQ